MDGETEPDYAQKRTRERAIPPDSRLIPGPGNAAVYLYERSFKNKKGMTKKTFYAKVFHDGDIPPAWHRSFTSAFARAKDVGAFLEKEERRLAKQAAEQPQQNSGLGWEPIKSPDHPAA